MFLFFLLDDFGRLLGCCYCDTIYFFVEPICVLRHLTMTRSLLWWFVSKVMPCQGNEPQKKNRASLSDFCLGWSNHFFHLFFK